MIEIINENLIVFPIRQVWLPVKDFEGIYEVSNYGKVKSLLRRVEWTTIDGRAGYRDISERILKVKIDKDGYFEHILSLKGKQAYRRCHRIVAEAFTPNIYNLPVIDHIDNIKSNNMYYNLRWTTSTDNTIAYYKSYHNVGKSLSGLTKKDWQDILKLHIQGKSYPEISELYKLNVTRPDSIGDVLSGRRLSTVTGFTEDMRKTDNTVGHKITHEQGMEILHKRLVLKVPLKELSIQYDVAASLISRICSGKRRPELLKAFKQDKGI